MTVGPHRLATRASRRALLRLALPCCDVPPWGTRASTRAVFPTAVRCLAGRPGCIRVFVSARAAKSVIPPNWFPRVCSFFYFGRGRLAASAFVSREEGRASSGIHICTPKPWLSRGTTRTHCKTFYTDLNSSGKQQFQHIVLKHNCSRPPVPFSLLPSSLLVVPPFSLLHVQRSLPLAQRMDKVPSACRPRHCCCSASLQRPLLHGTTHVLILLAAAADAPSGRGLFVRPRHRATSF